MIAQKVKNNSKKSKPVTAKAKPEKMKRSRKAKADESFEKYSKIKLFIFVLIGVCALLTTLNTLILAYNEKNVLSDDAYYYIVTAKNLVQTGIVSFDGIHETNGVHPLWFILITIIFKLGVADFPLKIQYFSVVLLEQIIWISIISSILIYGYINKNKTKKLFFSYLLACWFIYPPTYKLFHLGMETTLAAFLLLLMLYFYEQKKEFLFSMFAFLLTLARLDTFIFVISPLFLIYLIRNYQDKKVLMFKAFSIFSLPCLAIGAVALFNYINYGYFKTISAILKSSFPHITFHPTFLLDSVLKGIIDKTVLPLIYIIPLYMLIIFIVIFISQMKLKEKIRDKLDNKLFVYSLVGIFLISNLLLFQKWNKGISSWYSVMPLVFTGIVISLFISHKFQNRKKILNIIIVLFLLVNMTYNVSAILTGLNYKKSDTSLDLWTKSANPNSIFAATDSGAFAFWHDRKVVNLDGLINNYDYQDIIKNKELHDYLTDNNVDYLIVHIWEKKIPYRLRETEKMYKSRIAPDVLNGTYEEYNFYVYSYMYNTYSDEIKLLKENEVYRGNMGRDGLVNARIVIWRLK